MVSAIQVTTRITEGLFSVIRNILRFIRISFVPIVKVTSVICIISLLLGVVSAFIGLAFAGPFLHIFGPESFIINKAGVISIFVLVAIPIAGMIAFLMRVAFKVRMPKEVSFTLGTIWFVALFFCFYSGTMTAIDYKHKISEVEKSEYTMDGDLVFIGTLQEKIPFTKESEYVKAGIHFTKDKVVMENVRVECKETDSPFITVEKYVEARGLNENKARHRVRETENRFMIEGNQIWISPYLMFPDHEKWRGHQVTYIIYIPKDKKVDNQYSKDNHFSVHIGITD